MLKEPLKPGSDIKSGPQIVTDFVAALKNDSTLDPATVWVLERLVQNNSLTTVNLVRALEQARGKSKV